MKRIPVETRVSRRVGLARLLAGLLAVALMAVLCPVGSIPAQAAETGSTLYNKISGDTASGVALEMGVTKHTVRTITFQNSMPVEVGLTCWNAGGGNDVDTPKDTVKACATKSGVKADDGSVLWDVTYHANGVYPAFPANSSHLFDGLNNLVSFAGLNQVDTSNVTDMSGMFDSCWSLSSLDLSGFDTSKVTDMSDMFNACEKLTSLDFSKWKNFKTSSVTNMSRMFYMTTGLSSELTLLDVSTFDTSKVTDMSGMFFGCYKLTSLDLSGFDTSKVTDMHTMFTKCQNLQSLDLSTFDTSNVTDMKGMFMEMFSLKSLDFSKWPKFDTSKVTDMHSMFAYSRFESLDLSTFKTLNNTEMQEMLFDLPKLVELKLGAQFKFDDDILLLEPDASAAAPTGQTNIGKWRNTQTGEVYSYSESGGVLLPSNKAATYTPFANVAYTVAFDKNVDEATGGMADQSFAAGVAQKLRANEFKLKGYTFTGWNTARSGKGNSYGNEAEVTDLATSGTVTLYAQWETASHNVSFNTDGGKLPDGTPSQGTYKTGAALPTPSKDGYTFDGWQDKDGNKVDKVPAEPEDVELTAKWTGKDHNVSFDTDGGKLPDGTPSQGTYKTGAALPTPTRDGYTFDGWQDEDGNKVDKVPAEPEDVKLTAKWTGKDHKVEFDAGGGKLPDGTPSSGTYKTGDKLPTPTRDGYAFDGWYDENGNRVDKVPASPTNMKLTAKWSTPRLTRLFGEGRYDTMGKIVAQAYAGTETTVIVASGENYPDALAASGLSGVLDAPIVLTGPTSLSSQAVDQLKRLKPSKIIIAGGVNAVSANVASQLKSYASTVTRLGGDTRYDTSYLLYEQGVGSWGTTAIVATGANYADALSVSSYAYAGKAPVFLCDPATGLSAKQRTALSKFTRVVVVGGVNAVPANYVSGLPGMTRLSGAGRYETSVALAEWTAKNGLDMDGVVYATGENYPDALVSGPLAGRNKAPVLLVGGANSPTVSYSAKAKGKVTKAYVAGGVQAVSAATANALADALGIARP